jgi:hypothetical protein
LVEHNLSEEPNTDILNMDISKANLQELRQLRLHMAADTRAKLHHIEKLDAEIEVFNNKRLEEHKGKSGKPPIFIKTNVQEDLERKLSAMNMISWLERPAYLGSRSF